MAHTKNIGQNTCERVSANAWFNPTLSQRIRCCQPAEGSRNLTHNAKWNYDCIHDNKHDRDDDDNSGVTSKEPLLQNKMRPATAVAQVCRMAVAERARSAAAILGQRYDVDRMSPIFLQGHSLKTSRKSLPIDRGQQSKVQNEQALVTPANDVSSISAGRRVTPSSARRQNDNHSKTKLYCTPQSTVDKRIHNICLQTLSVPELKIKPALPLHKSSIQDLHADFHFRSTSKHAVSFDVLENSTTTDYDLSEYLKNLRVASKKFWTSRQSTSWLRRLEYEKDALSFISSPGRRQFDKMPQSANQRKTSFKMQNVTPASFSSLSLRHSARGSLAKTYKRNAAWRPLLSDETESTEYCNRCSNKGQQSFKACLAPEEFFKSAK